MDSSSVRAGLGVFEVKVEHFEFEPAYTVGAKRSFFPTFGKIADVKTETSGLKRSPLPSGESWENTSASEDGVQGRPTKRTASEAMGRVPAEDEGGRSRDRSPNSQPPTGVTKQAQQSQPLRKKVAVSRVNQATAAPREKPIGKQAQESLQSSANKEMPESRQESAPDHSAPPLSRCKRSRAQTSPRLGVESKSATKSRPCRDSQQVRAVKHFVMEVEREEIGHDDSDSAGGSRRTRRSALNSSSGKRSPDALSRGPSSLPQENGSPHGKEAERGVTFESQGKRKVDEVAKDNDESLKTIIVNARGEPEGSCVQLLINKITHLVEKLFPIHKTWVQISPEVKYATCQDVQSMFKDGQKLDSSWIKSEARRVHCTARRRAKTALWRAECERADS